MEKIRISLGFALMALAFVLLFCSTGHCQAPPPCAAPQPAPEAHTYAIEVHSPFQRDLIEYRKELWELIRQTFADEEKGLYDQKKYARILRLAKKLKNPASKDLSLSAITRFRAH